MIKRLLATAVILGCGCIGVFAQSVAITPKRTVYRRPKPISEYKKTFVVRRPVAKASTPALSKKITAAISPESILGLNIKEELGEYQWLEEADYKVLFNREGVLSISSWMEGTAAYPDGVTKYAVVDLRTGRRLSPADVFSSLPKLAALLKKQQAAEVNTAIEEIRKDPESQETDPKELFAETDLRAADIKDFSVDAKGVTFYYDYGFPHVIQALEPTGEYNLSWKELRPFIKRGSLLERFVK
jgi:hypothetical protein